MDEESRGFLLPVENLYTGLFNWRSFFFGAEEGKGILSRILL